MPTFVRGGELSRAFYEEVVQPLVATIHSAALLGWGSDVLGYDTERSTDHGWGPRLQVFVAPDAVAGVRAAIEEGLPPDFGGWPTRFGWDDVPVSIHVEVAELGAWLESRLGIDPRRGMAARDWLVTPQQLLLEVTRGPVFHDGLGELDEVRRVLAWYPDDVWLWLLACQWRRIDQEEPFVGRTAEVGDDLGSKLVAARLVRDVMRLCFLLERRYAPYSKWLGTAFRELEISVRIADALARALQATDARSREDAFLDALVVVADYHNDLRVTDPLDTAPRPFHSRPFRVLGSGRFVDACLARVSDPWLRGLPLVGSIDQLADSTDVLSNADVARRVAPVYGATT